MKVVITLIVTCLQLVKEHLTALPRCCLGLCKSYRNTLQQFCKQGSPMQWIDCTNSTFNILCISYSWCIVQLGLDIITFVTMHYSEKCLHMQSKYRCI